MGDQVNIMNKELTAEDFCFVCKDGGDLDICDYGDCLKAYHSYCCENNASFPKKESFFKCGWHLCHYCKKSSNLKCISCPKSLCWKCFRKHGDIVAMKELMGICIHCLKLALMIEENTNVDSDGETVDFNDIETYEFLFKDYWEIIKDKEKVSLTELRHAAASLKNNSYLDLEFDSEKNEIELSNAMDGEYQPEISSHTSRVKSKMGCPKRHLERKHFNGWGSEQLIVFLASIGVDCNEPIEQINVSSIIRKYITKNQLLDPIRKKKVKCDTKLISLFNKKSFKLNKINALLDSHYPDNLGDAFFFGSEEENELVEKKKRRIEQTTIPKLRNDSEIQKSCYASVVAENIKLLYLRKSLFLELLKNPEELENKVVGCFVRIKNNPKDLFYSRDKPYQLGQIIGIRKTQEVTDIVLRVTNLFNKDINISMLSDVDFEEEECEDLRQLIKNGHVKRPMFRDFETKSALLHADIMRHWIKRELATLQRQIERASEKGWQKELFELIDRRELLRTDAEQERLLKQIPHVIPDIDIPDVDIPAIDIPAIGIPDIDIPDVNIPDNDVPDNDIPDIDIPDIDIPNIEINTRSSVLTKRRYKANEVIFDENVSPCQTTGNGPILERHISEKTSKANEVIFDENVSPCQTTGNGPILERHISEKTSKDSKVNDNGSHRERQSKQIEIINLDEDDDDDVDGVLKNAKNKINIAIWNYIDPQNHVQGPFQLNHLRKWQAGGFFDEGFKVWKIGDPRDKSVLLTDLLREIKDV